jgi:hypothetical protein
MLCSACIEPVLLREYTVAHRGLLRPGSASSLELHQSGAGIWAARICAEMTLILAELSRYKLRSLMASVQHRAADELKKNRAAVVKY